MPSHRVNGTRTKTRQGAPARRLWRTLVCALTLWAGAASAQTCTFNANQPNAASFGTINPSLNTTMTFSITVNFRCTANADPLFTITGANDTGPGAYRLRNTAQPTRYMAYSVATAIVPGTRINLSGQLVAADYANAYVGNYTDTLNVLVLP